MDSINVEKIHALRKYKQQQFVNTLLFYPLATLTLGLFCTSPFWFPSLYSSTKTFLCVSIPRTLSLFFSAKSLFILGNLIIIFLVRESKVRSSDSDTVVKIPPKQEKVGFEEVKNYTILPLTSKEVVFDTSFEKKHVGFSSNGKIDGVGYVKDMERERCLHEVEDEEEEGEEGEPLEEEEREVGDEKERERLEKNQGWKLMIPPTSTDELKRRADDFIAMVNKQIRLEADEEGFAFSC